MLRTRRLTPAGFACLPNRHGFAQRLIGSIRRECLDNIIVLGETHLRRILRSYAMYYNKITTQYQFCPSADCPR
jgi:hypothetical protein